MADPRDARRNRGRTWAAAIAVPVLVVSGLALVVSGTGSGDTSARRPVAAVEVPSSTTTPVPFPSPSTGPEQNLEPRSEPSSEPTSESISRPAVVEGSPQLVAVPVLGIRAPVDPIVVEAGALTPPSDPGRIGWWSEGARPGARLGKAVLTGHTVNAGGGAFDDLETLELGGTVVVEATGGRVTYDVTSVRVLSRAQLARENESIFRPDGPHRLVLITCEDWDGVAYRSNVVVEATPRV